MIGCGHGPQRCSPISRYGETNLRRTELRELLSPDWSGCQPELCWTWHFEFFLCVKHGCFMVCRRRVHPQHHGGETPANRSRTDLFLSREAAFIHHSVDRGSSSASLFYHSIEAEKFFVDIFHHKPTLLLACPLGDYAVSYAKMQGSRYQSKPAIFLIGLAF